MERKALFFREFGMGYLILATSLFLITFAAGCGSGSGVTMTGGTEADQAAILEILESDAFFIDSATGTDGDRDAADSAQAQVYDGQVSIRSLSAESGTAELPRFWWRGDLERLGKEISIHIADGIADVKVSHEIAGTFFIADDVGDALVLWGKPFEDHVTRYAQFIRGSQGWTLSAISPVEFALANGKLQTVSIDSIRAFSGDELVWEATEPSTLFTVTAGLPTFIHGDEIRVEAAVSSSSESGWEPSRFVFLHRPGPHITGRRTRDIMFDDGTNGDLVAGDGIYTRLYTIGPCRGRHFAAVDVIDAATFMELDAAYNSGAWGMPYIVE
jgi:hypothetical protein